MKNNLSIKEQQFYRKYDNDTIISNEQLTTNLKKKELLIYKEQLKAYENIITSINQLLKNLNLTTPLDIFTCYCYLLWNGYLSQNKNYTYQYKDRKNIESCLGLDIINGHGVCLNNASALNDILVNFSYESYLITNKISTPINLEYNPNISKSNSKSIEISNKLLYTILRPLINKVGNHACTLVEKDNVYYIFDPTKLCVYKLDNFLSATIIGGTGKINIKPYSLKLYNNLENYEIIDIIESYQNTDYNPYTKKLIIESFNKSIYQCQQNSKLLNNFYLKNEENRAKILKIYKSKK